MSNVKIEKPLSADSTGKGTLFSGLSGKMPKDTGIFI
ncbi:ABC transporter permease, partial [Escherichia coli]|nr:ABC transporter permease [Escherichia coli]